jgi:hypothetical protein
MHLAGFETTISADERPQTHALDRVATGTGIQKMIITEMGHNHFDDQVNDIRY